MSACVTDKNNKTNSRLCMGLLNVCSLYHKVPFLINTLQFHNIGIICVTETWLNEAISSYELFMSDFDIHRCDRLSRGGGVLIAVRKKFSSTLENVLSTSSLELIHISIDRPFCKSLQVVCVYRPPNSDIDCFYSTFTNFLNNISYTNLPLLLLGDFNVNILESSAQKLTFLRFFKSYGLSCMSKTPSRISKTSSTLIDIVFANVLAQRDMNEVISSPVSYSDHDFVYFDYKKPRNISIRQYNESIHLSKSNIQKFTSRIESLLDIRTHSILDFNDIIQTDIEKIPKKKVLSLPHRSNCAWVTPNVLLSIQNRDRLCNLAKIYKTGNLVYLAGRAKLDCKQKLYLAKKNYFIKRVDSAKGDPKKFWKLLSPFIKPQRQTSVACLLDGDRIVTDCNDVANVFNRYFHDVISDLRIRTIRSRRIFYPKPLSCKFSFSMPSENYIMQLLNKLQHKPVGKNGIPFTLIHDSGCIIRNSIYFYICDSLRSGTFPQCYKNATVTPIHKAGSPKLVSNYRPISVLPNIGQLFERVVYNQLVQYLDRNSLFYDLQFGFRSKHSTKTAFISLMDFVCCERETGNVVLIVFIDFTKAFDMIDHQILLEKLRMHFNFDETVVQWMATYLDDRRQCVRIGSSYSELSSITSGVPQGSTLGPLLFLLYLNDIHNSVKHARVYLYADDAALVFSERSLNELVRVANSDLVSLFQYTEGNRMYINFNKSKTMLFDPKFSNRNTDDIVIEINNHKLENVKTFKYLGYHLDNRFSFRDEVDVLASKLSRCASVIARCRAFLDSYCLKSIFDCLAISYINYNHFIIFTVGKTLFNKIDNQYNNIGRILYGTVTSDLRNFNWITLQTRLHYMNLILLHSIIYRKHAPSLKSRLINKFTKYNIRNKLPYVMHSVRQSVHQKGFSYWAPRLWNHLETEIREKESLYAFKISLRLSVNA